LLDYFDFMAAGDEEIARSTVPRFALESVLIRLASLPQSLPVAELIERLERLEGKPKSMTRPPVVPTRARESTATAPQAPAISPAISSQSGVPASTTDKWGEFVAFVSKEKKFLGSHLASGSALTLPPEPLKIGVSERHHLSFLQDSDNFSALKELARKFFLQDVTVQIASVIAEGSPPATGMAQPTTHPTEDRSPMVKEALRIFGGSIRNVRRDNG